MTMETTIEIKSKWDGRILFSGELATLKEAVQTAVKEGAYLQGADLRGADLRGADLQGANIRDGITVIQSPIQITGLSWLVTIWDAHVQIGCEFHSHEEWNKFTNAQIKQMSDNALDFWHEHKISIMGLCHSHAKKVGE